MGLTVMIGFFIGMTVGVVIGSLMMVFLRSSAMFKGN
jgi:hypothetical protein